VLAELPRTPTGKIQKAPLRDMILRKLQAGQGALIEATAAKGIANHGAAIQGTPTSGIATETTAPRTTTQGPAA
jgi:hypothetical protein